MRSYSPVRTHVGVLWALGLVLAIHTGAGAQVGQNINVITGSDSQFTGDMFRQRQNESVGGISSINTSHIMVAYNDYRTVDYLEDAGAVVPPSLINATFQKLLRFLTWPVRMARGRSVELEGEEHEGAAAAQAFIGLSFSDNGGRDWYTGLHPGHRSLPPAAGAEIWDQSEVLRGYEAASDPVMATTDRQFFVGGIAFTPDAGSVGFVSRFTDRNDSETAANIHFDGTRILMTQTSSRFFVDKPSIAAALGPNGATYVYAAFVVFDQSDPLTSKIQLFRSIDGGVTWTTGTVVSEPLTRNQSPWILIDPNDARTMYIGWRVFSARTGGIANAIVGKKSTDGGASFTTSLPYPVALFLKPFDQPQGDLRAGSLPIPRSNAYPTAAIDGNGVIHMALQEYVYPANYPLSSLRGLPLAPGVKTSVGVPRITVTSSANGGASWTLRTAIDLGNGAGSQFMPVITAVGEPGPSCAGNAGRPRSRVMVMYYDARSGGIGTAAGGNGYVAGGNRQFDVRIAEAAACARDLLGRLVFGPSQQMSRYSLSATPPHGIVQTPGYGFTAVNRGYGIFCGGYCAFSGDYIHLVPRQPYVQTPTGWKLTTARGVDQSQLPAPVVQGFWADTRNVILPTNPAPTLQPNQPGFIDSLPFWNYQSPGSGKPPSACFNAGSRDQNVYSAEYSPGNLFAGAPITFRRDNIPHAYPLFVENRAGVQRFFRLTIRSPQASFDYRSFDRTLPSPPPPDVEADIAIGPYSSVTGSVVVDAGAIGPIRVTVEELASTVVNGVTTSNGALLPGGAKTSVTLVTGGGTELATTETHTPVVAPTPIVTRPLAGQVDPDNPVTMTPFTQQPFTQQTSILNPFTQQPFTQQTTVYDVIDVTFPVALAGDQAAAASALLAVQNAQQLTGSYLFQVIISRVALTPATDGCSSFDTVHELQVSNIRAPFTQQPFTQQPFTQQPFTQQPFTQQPFTQQPFTQQPFTQQSDPRDPVLSTSTFYLAPSPTPGQTAGLRAADRMLARSAPGARLTPVGLQPAPPGPDDYRADRADLGLTYTLRAFQIAANPPVRILDPVTGEANVGVSVATDTPEIVVINGTPQFDPAGPPVSSGGAGVPVMLTFVQQPVTTGVGQTMAPVSVAVQDGFGRTLVNLPPTPVTVALANNPGAATLGGTLTVNTVQGIATFTNLSVNQTGTAFTLRASSPNVPDATSAPFDVIAAANQLVFTVQPTSTPRALTIAPPIQVAIRDAAGNPTTSTAVVQMQILNNPGGGTLTGTTSVAAVNGVATFSNLAITLPGVGYTLQATSAGLTPVTSQPFDIVVPPPTAFESVLNTDFASFGRAGMRGGNGTGTIEVAGISGPVTRALLFWNGPSNSSDPAANAAVSFNGNPITGTNSGFANSNCWPFANTQSYRADVTGLVTGNGTYALSDFVKAGPPAVDMNGVSLVVFFSDESTANNRDVYVLSTNDSNIALAGFDAQDWSTTINGVNYVGGAGQLQLHVGDGQTFTDGEVFLNGTQILGAGANFDGNTVPPTVGLGNGLWDIRSFTIPAGVLTIGSNSLTVTSPPAGDCLTLVVMLVSVPTLPPVIGLPGPVADRSPAAAPWAADDRRRRGDIHAFGR